jgi:hypothetical protein
MDIDLNADLGEGYGPWRMGEDEAMLATDLVGQRRLRSSMPATRSSWIAQRAWH